MDKQKSEVRSQRSEQAPEPPPAGEILFCKCGWYGKVEDQDALGSECGCCPDCGNEDLEWPGDLFKRIKELEAENKQLTLYKEYVDTRINEGEMPWLFEIWLQNIDELARDLEEFIDDHPYEQQAVTKMPKSCTVYPCTRTPQEAKLEKDENGFMVCPLCKRFYGKP